MSLAWLIHAIVSDGAGLGQPPVDACERAATETIARAEKIGSHAYRENLLMLALRMRESVLLDLPTQPYGDQRT